jgi:predicted amidohydrolase
MRVGFVQFSPVRGGGSDNIDLAARIIGSQTADLWVLPELTTSGYLFTDHSELLKWAEEIPNSPSINRLRELAQELGAALIAGFPERHGDHIYNSAVGVSSDGKIVGVYRKIHLFDTEKLGFTPGNKPLEIWEIDGAKVGVIICFDWIFPEITRSLALHGAEIIAHPSNLVLPHAPDAMRTRCLENRVFAVTANRIGSESLSDLQRTFIGKSQVMDPLGVRLIAASGHETVAKVADINLTLAQDKYVTARNHIFQDRKPQFYQLS